MTNMFDNKKNEDFLDRVGLKAEEWKGFLDQEVEFEGKLSLTGTFRCDADFKGEIDCDGLLILGDSARVEGTLRAKQMSVQGKVKGSIHAEEKLVLLQDSVVCGDIYTACLIIEAGAAFDGTCHMPTSEGVAKELPAAEPEQMPEPVTLPVTAEKQA